MTWTQQLAHVPNQPTVFDCCQYVLSYQASVHSVWLDLHYQGSHKLLFNVTVFGGSLEFIQVQKHAISMHALSRLGM